MPKNTSAHDADVSTAEVGEPREDAVKPKSKLSESVVAAEVHKGEKDEEDITGEGKQDGGKDASDSEMSVLIDEEPAKKRKGRKSKDSVRFVILEFTSNAQLNALFDLLQSADGVRTIAF